jgi:hypothetical protein
MTTIDPTEFERLAQQVRDAEAAYHAAFDLRAKANVAANEANCVWIERKAEFQAYVDQFTQGGAA